MGFEEMGRILIIGSTEECIELAKRWENAEILVSDPAQYVILKKEFEGIKVHFGDWSNVEVLSKLDLSNVDTVFISTGNDNSNLKCAQTVKGISFAKIIVMVYEMHNIKKFEDVGIEHVICPKKVAIETVDEMVQPEPHKITQVLITEHSLSIGLEVGEILLPSDCKITSLERGDITIVPRREIVVQKGDMLTIISSTTNPETIRKLIHGGHELFSPVNRLFVLPMEPEDILKAVREATCVASGINADILLLMANEDFKTAETNISGLSNKIDKIVKSARVRFSILLSENLYKTLKNMLIDHEELELKDKPLAPPDCVLVSEERLNLIDTIRGKSKILGILDNMRTPLIVARKFNKYKKILVFLGKDVHPEKGGCFAIRLCYAFSPKLYVFLSDRDDKKVLDAGRYIKKLCVTYGLECEFASARENPSNEFADLVSSNEFDLVVFDWGTKSINSEIKRQILLDAPCSILTVP